MQGCQGGMEHKLAPLAPLPANWPFPRTPEVNMSRVTRRTFTAAASAAALSASAYGRVLGANDRVTLGCIGVGNRGDQLLDAFLTHKDVNVAAVCDVYEPYLPAAAAKALKATGTEPTPFKDYRK